MDALLALRLPPPPPDTPPVRQSELLVPSTCELPSLIDSVKRPVCRWGEDVVLTRIRYGPEPVNACDTRDAQPGPPSSLMIDCARSSPRTISTGSKSVDARSIVKVRPGAVMNW